MSELWAALGLVLFLEGAAYALFPETMRRMMRAVIETPESGLRQAGAACAIMGAVVVWLARG